ncbi:MAG: DNA translocase FtsK 4TM domain-containing protein, partial [Caldimicrobium sp.]
MEIQVKKILGLIFYISFIILLALSIYSYDPLDPGFGIVGTSEVKNYAGWIGAFLASFFIFIFGITALFIPPILALSLIFYFYRIPLKNLFLIFSFLILFFSFGFSFLFDLIQIKSSYFLDKFPYHGGFLGELGILLMRIVGVPVFLGILILILLLTVIFFSFTFQINQREFLKKFFSLFTSKKREELGKEIEPQIKSEAQVKLEPEIKDITIKEERIEAVDEAVEEKENLENVQKGVAIKEAIVLPPPIDLLQEPIFSSYKIKPEELKERALLLKAKLREFGIEGEVTGINPGPVITV